MTFHSFKSGLLASLWMGALGAASVIASALPAHAQVSLSTSPTTETFDSLGPTATATLPSGFKVDKNLSIGSVGTFAAAGTATEQVDGASVSASATNGIYNFGSGTTDTGPDRAVGFLASGSATKSGNLYVQLRNDTGAGVTQLPLSYKVEKYRNGSNAAGFRIQLFFSTDGGATFTSAGSGFLTSFPADADSNGATPAPLNSTAVSGTLSLPTALAPSASVVLAWNYSVVSGTTTSNAPALAIDDFSFSGTDGGTPTGTPTATPSGTPTATPTTTPAPTPLPSAPTAGVIISEYRLSGPSGASDEFIELYNQGNTSLDLASWSVVSGGVTIPIPSGKVIPPYGHLLLTNSTATTGYSLANYGGTGAAAGDVTYSGDIAFGTTLTLRNAAGGAVDVVSSSGLPSPTLATSNYSYVRRMDGAGGAPLDTNSDLNDFNLVDVQSTVGPNNTTGVSSGILRLGAPGPQNLASPTTGNSFISFTQTGFTRTGTGNSGTLSVRGVITNRAGSGRTFTAFRLRSVGLTAGTTDPVNTTPADVRLISSTVSGSDVLPLLLQQPPSQPNGGGLNCSLSLAALPGGGLTPGQTISVEFLFNIFQKGTFRYLFNVEPVTTDGAGSVRADDDNLLLGNPSAAIDVASSTNKENLLVEHPGESIGYRKSIGGPRWVSWHLDSNDIGSSGRSDNFRPDTALPADCRITDNDYSGSGFDRGHQCPSGDRTASDTLNGDTFFMSNMLPQTAELNQKVWATLENYCRDQVSAGNECYIISGGVGSSGTIAGGKVTVPASCWKVVVILPKGTSDISRMTKSTRVISVLMPNTTTVSGSYTNYYSTVDAIESATGLDLLSNLPDDIENYLEASTTNR